MEFNSEINTGVNANDGLGDGLRTNMRKLIDNDNHLKQEKVDKEAGKGLSSNDYTDEDKQLNLSVSSLQQVTEAGNTSTLPIVVSQGTSPRVTLFEDDDQGSILLENPQGDTLAITPNSMVLFEGENENQMFLSFEGLTDMRSLYFPNKSGVLAVSEDIVLKKSKISFTPSQLATWGTTPEVLIPAQGANTIINIHSAIIVYNYNEGPDYILDENPIRIYAQGSDSNLYYFSSARHIFQMGGDVVKVFPRTLTTDISKNITVNKPILIQAADYTLGTGTVDIHLTYEVIQL